MPKTVTAIVMCAGSSTRMGADKIFADINGTPVIAKTLTAFEKSALVTDIVAVSRPETFSKLREVAKNFCITKLKTLAVGGKTRAHSVLCGLGCATGDYVAITDGARPLTSTGLINSVITDAFMHGAAAPAIAVADTLKRVDNDGFIENTVSRESLVRIQTPQVFLREKYFSMLKKAINLDATFTDDCSVYEYFGGKVKITNGSSFNIKLTVPEDIDICERLDGKMNVRVGHGYDVHRFKEERELWLCGEKIEYEFGLDGHSDADVALHALTDAILGATGLGDIGRHFPDNDPQYKGISSMLLLERVWKEVREKYVFGNCDVTIIAQKPKLMPYIDKMAKNIADLVGTELGNVNVKATTEEKLGFTGRLEGISAHAVCTLYKR